jgi:hypothetical protein
VSVIDPEHSQVPNLPTSLAVRYPTMSSRVLHRTPPRMALRSLVTRLQHPPAVVTRLIFCMDDSSRYHRNPPTLGNLYWRDKAPIAS